MPHLEPFASITHNILRLLTRAIEAEPGYARAYNTRGTARTTRQDWDGAIADFTKAIEINPKYAKA